LCHNIEKDCVGKYDSNDKYKVICDYEKCQQNPFNITCGKNKCAKDTASCKAYLKLEEFTNSIIFKTSMHSSIMSSKIKNFNLQLSHGIQTLNNKAKNCPKIEYVWKADDACVSHGNCFNGFKHNTKFGVIKVDCPCKGINAYECANSFCTLNKRACDYMLQKKIKLAKADVYGIKKCPSRLIHNGFSLLDIIMFKIKN